MEKYFIFTDIDGTLFDHDANCIPEATYQALNKAKENGHKIFLSSGRTYSDLDEIFKSLPVDGFVLGCGGQVIIDNKESATSAMPKEVSKEIIDFFVKNNVGFSTEGLRCIHIYGEAYEMYRSWLAHLNDGKPLSNEQLDEILAKRNTFGYDKITEDDYDNILKLSFFTKNREVVAEYMKTLPDDIFAYFDDMNPELHSGEFYMKDTNKATGMNKVLEYFNHPIENTIALGDTLNDVEMIKHASIGIAMGNGQQPLKDAADFVTKRIDEDGFAYALEKYGII